MTIDTTTTTQCDGCANGARRIVTTSWSLTGPPAPLTWKRSTVLKDLGWKQFRASKGKTCRDEHGRGESGDDLGDGAWSIC